MSALRPLPILALAAVVAASLLAPRPSAALGAGVFVEVTGTGLASSDHACAPPFGVRSRGDIGEIIGGPESCSGHPQWHVQWSGDGRIGWSAATGLRAVQCDDRDRDGCLPPPCGPDCNDSVAAVGCRDEVCDDGRDNDCDGDTDCRDTDCGRDDDRDGCVLAPCGADCNDDDPAVGCRGEICGDGADNDCDGATDCQDAACISDRDRDGCLAPPCGTDCNDTVAAVGCRDELCDDGRDNDCDGETDCRDTDCSRDDDRDGCVLVPCGDDCDDGDPLVGCVREVCEDGRDNDCNGLADCRDQSCAREPCNDGVFCNGPDACTNGRCQPVAGNPCPGPDEDGNCAESCDELGANCRAPDPDGSPCDLGLSETVSDMCQGGMCFPGPPPNDHCSTATIVTATPFNADQDTFRGGQDLADPVPSCSAKLTGRSTVWYRFTPPRDGVIIASSFFSNYDTALVAYTGTCANPAAANLVEVACSSDTGSDLQSQVVFDALANTTYHFMVTSESDMTPIPPGGVLRFSLQLLDVFSDCCAAHDTPGCAVPECQTCVCDEPMNGEPVMNPQLDPGCCTTVWDEACVPPVTGAGACAPHCPCGYCGDGVINLGEECDDGNPIADDGCKPDCTLSPGGTTTTLATPTTTLASSSTTTTTLVAAPSGAATPVCAPGPCDTYPIAGRRLHIRVDPTAPRDSRLIFLARTRYELPSESHAPTSTGAQLTLRDRSGHHARFALPAAGWKALGRNGSKGYVYADKRRRHGPCTRVVLKGGTSIRARCTGAGLEMALPLLDPVDVTLQVGTRASSTSYCAQFGGAITRNGRSVFLAAGARKPSGCAIATP